MRAYLGFLPTSSWFIFYMQGNQLAITLKKH